MHRIPDLPALERSALESLTISRVLMKGHPVFERGPWRGIGRRNIVEVRSQSVFEQEDNLRSQVAPSIFPNGFLGAFPVDLSRTNG